MVKIYIEKIICFLLAVLIIALQVYPYKGSSTVSNQERTETRINEYDFVLAQGIVLNTLKDHRSTAEIKTSDYKSIDTDDLSLFDDVVDYKKIYDGRYSTLFKNSSFLIAHFSTST